MIYFSVNNGPDTKYDDDNAGEAMVALAEALDDPDSHYVCFEYVLDTPGPSTEER